ncbi:signal peptidase I [Macrococcus equipercicus]|uniref:Signal peptidase I n=1 Tax=Macrococcus equipercicus TaxID=69967 RepID=A0A9Q9BQQ3_9STAP|nr:signal peptidase I [Macrococcus equipercicus]UTH14970.1 signal peptidase I [Macrococcus equipercicus]
MKKEIKEWLIALLVALSVYFLITNFLMVIYTISGDSMFPTFKDKEKVIVSKISKTLNHIDRGDVIVFHANREDDYIKRLVGLPGDKVVYKDDVLYINGRKVEEEYLDENKIAKKGELLTENFTVKELINSDGTDIIPKNKYLVLGDNREISIDSRRSLGLINKKDVVGKVVLRFWPFDYFHYNFYPNSYDEVNKEN